MTKSNKRVIAIHCHFYQPPRENPWTDEIEFQESAHPYHDWNERIAKECYTPNTASRILDGLGRIEKVVNNYEHISFNIGPTLTRWMEKHTPETLEKIVLADKKSQKKQNGHGNAIAQCFNHMIMPLCTRRDKETQVAWGKSEFKHRFGRETEGIWLPETGCNNETLEVLVEQDIKFVILSPTQAESVRELSGGDFWDVSHENIDVTMPYRYFPFAQDKERYIDIFFYHGALSRGVSFDHLLRNADEYSKRMDESFKHGESGNQIVSVCTDGESYGHHESFGDMAVAYIAESEKINKNFEFGNFGNFLEQNPPHMEVRLKAGKNNLGTSWSCAHGVGRWMEDCGCHTGGMPGWNQKWRKGLRDSLDWLRDELDKLCQREGRKYFKDFWAARNDYIQILLSPTAENKSRFFKKHQVTALSNEECANALVLMEIQKDAMYMYTSCGWFFNELSGIETTQILQYASRAMMTVRDIYSINLEPKFLSLLEKAKSNLEEHKNGRVIYEKLVRPSAISWEREAAHFLAEVPFSGFPDESKIFNGSVKKEFEEHRVFDKFSLVAGKITITSKETGYKRESTFVVTHKELDLKCFIAQNADKFAHESILKLLEYPKEVTRELFEKEVGAILGKKFLTLHDILFDKREKLIKNILAQKIEKFQSMYFKIFDETRGIVEKVGYEKTPKPIELKVPAEITLSCRLRSEVEAMLSQKTFTSSQKAIGLMHYAESLGVELDTKEAEVTFKKAIESKMQSLLTKTSRVRAEEILSMLSAAKELFPNMDKTKLENYVYTIIKDKIEHKMDGVLQKNSPRSKYELVRSLINLAERLNFNMDRFNQALAPIETLIVNDSSLWP